MKLDDCVDCRVPLQPGTLVETWQCEQCRLTFTTCAYCSKLSMRLDAPSQCVNEECAAFRIEWRTCNNCNQISRPVIAKSELATCLTPECVIGLTMSECAACGQGYPAALGVCPQPGCILALKRVETCCFCFQRSREPSAAICHNRQCSCWNTAVQRCKRCDEWSVVAGKAEQGCANPSCGDYCAPTLPRPSSPLPPQPPLENLLDRMASPAVFRQRYEMLKSMHEGGMGKIWRGMDRLLGREIAVKVAHSSLADSAAAREQFLKEARIGGRLLHPNVLPVFDVGITPSREIYFTMRFVNGESLRRSLDAIATACSTNLVEFPLVKTVDAFTRICQGVDFAHQNNVIHLDLKPDNVLVSGFNEVFVIDWGLARVDGEDDLARLYELYGGRTAEHSTRCDYNEQGRRVIGTPGFMAPEQVDGDPKRFGQATDIFGLGGILYYILYGHAPCRPPGVTDFMEIMKSTRSPQRRGRLREGIMARGQRVTKEAADFLRELERICLKCLERDPKERFPRVEDLIVELNDLRRP